MVTNTEERDKQSAGDRTLKDISPKVAGLLCYVAGWISGVVFLVLEQKNRFIRFHALQSIIVFGALSIAGAILGRIPYIGIAFNTIIWTTGFILWIILMVKAYSGETFKLPWAGALAEKLTAQSMPPTHGHNISQDGTASPTESISKSAPQADSSAVTSLQSARETKRDAFRAKYYSTGARTGRIVGSAVGIAFSLALLIFLNFFNQYIAYYQSSPSGGFTYHTLVTADFNIWLPVVTTTLSLAIIAHAFLIVFDKYLLHQIFEIFVNIFGLAAVISLLAIFPFDFSVIPNENAAFWIPVGLTITFIIVAVGLGIGALVRFIQLIANAAEGKY